MGRSLSRFQRSRQIRHHLTSIKVTSADGGPV